MVKHYEFFVMTQDEYYTEYIGDKVKASQATRAAGSLRRQASRTESCLW